MILDLFCGAGGWGQGARLAGLPDPIGIELDAHACAAHQAAGLPTILADVATFPLGHFGPVTGLIASPPCTDYSAAGDQAGYTGATGHLIDEVARWATALRPAWVACEQVPSVLPAWRYSAALLAGHGYSTWAGVLNAADYGVPQHRQRAVLIARLTGPAEPPEPSHHEHGGPTLFGGNEAPWVTMADAIGWGDTDRPSTAVVANGFGGSLIDGGSASRTDRWRRIDEGTFVLPDDRRPPPRPARARAGRSDGREAPGPTIHVTDEEGLTLQGFPPGWPVAGPGQARRAQIGNAVPPPLAAAILGAAAHG